MPRGKRTNPRHPIDPGAPPSVIAERFGGLSSFASALDMNPSTVHRWLVRGTINPKHHDLILAAAAARKVRVKPADFIDSRPPEQRGAPQPAEQATA